MKKYYKILTTVVLLLTPFVTLATTIGNLTYDQETKIITDNVSDAKYLGWDVLLGYTFAETKTMTEAGEIYQGYHIATQADAYRFFNALTPKGLVEITDRVYVDKNGLTDEKNSLVDGVFVDSPEYGAVFSYSEDLFDQASLGNTYDPDNISLSAFLSENTDYPVGLLYIDGGQLALYEGGWTFDSFNEQVGFPDIPEYSGYLGVGFLLVSNVPIPSAIWFMGSSIFGLLVFFGKKKPLVLTR